MTVVMSKEQDSQALISSARSGDREAFGQLVSRDRSRLRALVASRLAAHVVLGVDIEDVYQETLLRAFKSISRLEWRGEESFLRWAGGIAEHVILDLARRRARERRTSLDKADVPDRGVSPSHALRRDERFERLAASLKRLSPEHREVIVLTRVERLNFDEAARRMGRSPDAVKQLLYRALKQLKAEFGDTESLHLPGRSLCSESEGSRERRG
jgi:RNA polymerase sigma-70 factor (ECF subfamily)